MHSIVQNKHIISKEEIEVTLQQLSWKPLSSLTHGYTLLRKHLQD